jgi:hypothetical protein
MEAVVDPFGRASIKTGDDEVEVEAESGSSIRAAAKRS